MQIDERLLPTYLFHVFSNVDTIRTVSSHCHKVRQCRSMPGIWIICPYILIEIHVYTNELHPEPFVRRGLRIGNVEIYAVMRFA